MKLTEFIFACLVFLSFVSIPLSQENEKAILRDELVEAYCTETIAARLDNFAITVQNEPNSQAYLVFHGKSKQEGKNLLYQSYYKGYLVDSRGIDPNRIIILGGESRNKMSFQLWTVPLGAKPPKPEKEFVKEKISSTVRYDKDWADFHRMYGDLNIHPDGFSNWGCNPGLNMSGFAEALLSEPKTTGYLVVYTKFGKGKTYGDKVARFAKNELIKLHKVPRNRLRTIYGGNRKEPEMELWFVPKSGKLPEILPDKRKGK
jgi:hypothetical protein